MDAAAQIETVPLRELSDRDREIIAFERPVSVRVRPGGWASSSEHDQGRGKERDGGCAAHQGSLRAGPAAPYPIPCLQAGASRASGPPAFRGTRHTARAFALEGVEC